MAAAKGSWRSHSSNLSPRYSSDISGTSRAASGQIEDQAEHIFTIFAKSSLVDIVLFLSWALEEMALTEVALGIILHFVWTFWIAQAKLE